VRTYAETLPYTYASRGALQTALKSYWKFLGRTDCPAWAVPCPKKPRLVSRRLNEDELQAVLETAAQLGPRVHAACAVAYYTGIRRAEIATLRWSQLHRDRLHIVGKGAVERYVPVVHERLHAALQALPRSSEYVFPGQRGGHVNPGTINFWVKQVADITGIDLWPHRFRHTAITNGYRATRDMVAVQEFAGHADARTTRGYIHCEWEAVEAVALAL
jgi:integrase